MIKRLAKTRIEKIYFLLLIAVVLGLALRLYGIRWGLPNALHPEYSYHPDEVFHLIYARMLVDGTIIGKQFMYGGTFYYSILYAYYFVGDRFADLLGGANYFASTILFGRYVHTMLAILTILIVYQCGRAFFGKTAGGLAAVILAVMPGHILCAQRMRPDEIAAFLSALTILLSWRLVSTDQGVRLRLYIITGLLLGVATALRFPLAIMIVAPVAAHAFASGGKNGAEVLRSLLDWKMAAMLVAVFLGYAVASPHTFMYPDWFMQGMKIQWRYQSNPFMDAVDAGPGIYQYGWTMLHEAMGYPIYFLALGGIVLALIKRSRADIVILAAAVPYFILTTFTSWVVVRYTLPLLPPLAILAGRFVVYVAEEIPRHKIAAYAVLAMALSVTVMADYAYLKMEAGEDVRDEASGWIQDKLPKGSSILTVRAYYEDYYFNPVVPPGYQAPVFFLTGNVDSAPLFQDFGFDYLVLNELIYKNMERLGERHPYERVRIFHESLANSHYRRIKEFKQPIEAMGIDFSSWFTSHDYVIANPEIRIYQYQG